VLTNLGTLGSLTPIFVTSAHEYIWGEFEWYMPAVIAKFDSRAAKFFTAASFILATIGNQIAAGKLPVGNFQRGSCITHVHSGSYPFSNDVSGMCPKYINIFRGTIFISIFCVVSTPWNIIKNASGLLAFLSGYSCLMGPLAGTMVCDYYLIKKRKLDVDELYHDRGLYWYNAGFNWRAFVSFLVGFAPLIPGFAKSIQHTLDVGGAWKIYCFAWIFGFSLSMAVHYVINVYVSPATEALVEVAIYPPHVGDGGLPTVVEGESVKETPKEAYVAKEHEMNSPV
jgi:nucleobase:cation symporter-1, NCS1 family